MTSFLRSYAEIPQRFEQLRTTIDTVWIYPPADIAYALSTTTYKYKYDGTNIVCPDMANLIGVQNAIYFRTTVTQPVGNVGYSIGVGSLLKDLGEVINFKLETGEKVIGWRLVQQLTPQLPATVIPVPGNSPPNTIGYVTTFTSYKSLAEMGGNIYLDLPFVVRTG